MKTITKTFLTLIPSCIFTLSMAISSSATFASELEVNLTDIEKQSGQILLAIYDSEDAYNGNGEPIQTASIDVYEESITLNFNGLPDGTYAIKLIHDLNNNGQMDINAMGLPQDGYGFSNNVGKYGLPPFNAAKFDVIDTATIKMVVRPPVSF
ncbi:DUF2141 domain-containing protein [Glaciecola petra]|uniref:DUF2141 domain-containing protein n=1 Tax=Glaciecola petra TaxID=3075602 RepID=A0ABU2ZQC0_9ALTE|nr:DUF2141 domain-containing protein [Aestuariibacter sp. P117]MDT0594824.1 DUF2141 domain-containing protein [Aestuariibacter sp. P117]